MLRKWCVIMSCRRPVSYGFPVREVMSNVSSEVVHVFDLVWLCVWKRERLHTYKDLAGTLGMAHVQRVIPDMSAVNKVRYTVLFLTDGSKSTLNKVCKYDFLHCRRYGIVLKDGPVPVRGGTNAGAPKSSPKPEPIVGRGCRS